MAIDSKGRNANPLDKFQSYAFHHILMVAGTTEALRSIQTNDINGSFDTAKFENLSLTKPLEGTATNGSSGVFVICDSRKNSNYSLKDIRYTAVMGQGDAVNVQTINGTIKMQLYDFYGVSFLNYLQFLIDDALNIEYSSMAWMLKTIFIGHTHDGNTEMVTTSELAMGLVGIEVDFKEDGGHYGLTFTSLPGGAPAYESRANMVGQSATVIKSDKNRTLLSVINDFQNHLNQELKDYYDKLKVKQLPAAGTDSPGIKSSTGQASNQQGKLVQYMFTIPDEWNSWTVDGGAECHIETNWKKQTQDKSPSNAASVSKTVVSVPNTAVGSVNISLKPDMSIDAALLEILKHCDQVNALASDDKRTDGKEVHVSKIMSAVTSDEETVCLHWDIFAHKVPNVITSSEKGSVDTNAAQQNPLVPGNFDTDSNGVKRPKNSLEFDYIYSGKNNDIIKFDMKIKDAILALSNNVNVSAQTKTLQLQKNNIPSPKTEEKPNVTFIRKNTPIFMPLKTKDQLTAFSYITPGSSQSSRANQEHKKQLAILYSTGSYESKLLIRGNPLLLNLATFKLGPHVKGPLAAQGAGSGSTSNQAEYRKHINEIRSKTTADESALGNNVIVNPLLVKVNVFAPDISFNGITNASGSTDFATKFWYTDYYQVYMVSNSFNSDGTFTQELLLTAVPMYSAESIAASDVKSSA